MSSSDCNTVRSHLSAYHDGELSAGQAATVAKHVESCESCAAELSAFEVNRVGFRSDAHASEAF